MEVAVRFGKTVMDGRNQGWTILNKFYKTGILSKAVVVFWFVWFHRANSFVQVLTVALFVKNFPANYIVWNFVSASVKPTMLYPQIMEI